MALGEALAADWGAQVRTSPGGEPTGALRLAADDPRTGWQYAHWLVAHAAERGVRRVHFEELAWTAADGEWAAAGGHADQVRAELAAR